MKHRYGAIVAVLALVLVVSPVEAGNDPGKLQSKRDAIVDMSHRTLDRLISENPRANELFEQAAGYAVFDNFKVTLLVSGGGGVGVAVDRSTGERTFMKMGTGGLGLGLGGQSYQAVFLFEDAATFDRFVNKGWQADASANAVAGTSGVNAGATFTNGLAVFQLTNKGLMAQADVSGTKYWKSKKLNRR